MTGDGIGFTAVADVGVGTDDITADNQADDKFEEFDKTKGDVGDFEDFQEPDIVGVGEELPEFISVPVINKVRIKNQNVDVGDSDEEESRPRTARTARAGNAARQPRRETTRQEQEL